MKEVLLSIIVGALSLSSTVFAGTMLYPVTPTKTIMWHQEGFADNVTADSLGLITPEWDSERETNFPTLSPAGDVAQIATLPIIPKPEPVTMLIVGVSMAGLGSLGRKRKG
jgi:hypothetical protein